MSANCISGASARPSGGKTWQQLLQSLETLNPKYTQGYSLLKSESGDSGAHSVTLLSSKNGYPPILVEARHPDEQKYGNYTTFRVKAVCAEELPDCRARSVQDAVMQIIRHINTTHQPAVA